MKTIFDKISTDQFRHNISNYINFHIDFEAKIKKHNSNSDLCVIEFPIHKSYIPSSNYNKYDLFVDTSDPFLGIYDPNQKEMLEIYMLTQYENTNPGSYYQLIVAAENEYEAKKLHPYSNMYKNADIDDYMYTNWTSPENVIVTFIGRSRNFLEKNIILSKERYD